MDKQCTERTPKDTSLVQLEQPLNTHISSSSLHSFDSSTPISVLIVCSREEPDMRWCRNIEQGLHPLSRAGIIALWHEGMIAPGAERRQEIEVHLDQAALILLLLSQSFFASETCYTVQQRAMEKQKQKNVAVVPVIGWKHSRLSAM